MLLLPKELSSSSLLYFLLPQQIELQAGAHDGAHGAGHGGGGGGHGGGG